MGHAYTETPCKKTACCDYPPLSQDGVTARMAISAHAVNLIEIRLGERWQPILNQSSMTGSPTTNKADCHWWVTKSRLSRHAGLATSLAKLQHKENTSFSCEAVCYLFNGRIRK